MTDWNSLVREALKRLRADETFVRGAKLRGHVAALGLERGEDLDGFLQETKQKFGKLVEEDPDVVVHRPVGTDMLVGFRSAPWPSPVAGEMTERRHGIRFRQDVYAALTLITDRPFYYVQSRDEFTQDPQEGDHRIDLPSVALEILLEQRRQFAEGQASDDVKKELQRAIDRSPNPLVDFQRAIGFQSLGREWHDFKATVLMERLEEWAQHNGIEVSPSWLAEQRPMDTRLSPQDLLARFAQYMTDEEVRSMQVPFRALEEMYVRLRVDKTASTR